MGTTSRAPAVIDALVALLQAAPGLSGVTVFDGPTVTAASIRDLITVGWDGDDDNDEAVQSDQAWAGLGAKSKDETLLITCAAIAWRGETDVKPVRDRAYALVGEVETALRSDPSLGFPPPTTVAFATGNAYQRQTDGGAEARVVFTVAVQTRI
ncbi:hypothetical protein N5079_19800 [Planotetraspora sp. A-T 1434]|uniref:hypothetical protein n=1 Tax=Planotetraspora sp. A-T 1434 TaxID=2979219 RepID=UPI0021BDF5B9|nr:hypothetical protein [Planotetraspora sp. A-T 1434]MCT9932449.1 hypothetical protein [Planotetraspora sp. A-T 1434]